MSARRLARILRAEYERGLDHGGTGRLPDPTLFVVARSYEDLRRLAYDKGYSDGKALRAESWAKPMRISHPLA